MPRARVRKNRVTIICPACRDFDVAKGYSPDGDVAGVHMVPFDGAVQPKWSFDGNLERPSLHPSLRVTLTYGDERAPYVCHSIVTNGQIAYQADCTHVMRGQTVDLLEIAPRDDDAS